MSPDPEKSGEEYLRLRFRLTTFFANRNCRFGDDLADETINRVCQKIGQVEVENKLAFVYGFAKNVFFESLRKEKDHLDIDQLNIAANQAEEFDDPVADCLDKCLKKLSVTDRILVLDYFSEEKQAKIDLHKQIAESLKMTQTALRMKIMRLKQKLRICVNECLA